MKKTNKKDVIALDIFRKSGKKGGDTTAKRGTDYYKEIGEKGAKIRWEKKKNESVPLPAVNGL